MSILDVDKKHDSGNFISFDVGDMEDDGELVQRSTPFTHPSMHSFMQTCMHVSIPSKPKTFRFFLLATPLLAPLTISGSPSQCILLPATYLLPTSHPATHPRRHYHSLVRDAFLRLYEGDLCLLGYPANASLPVSPLLSGGAIDDPAAFARCAHERDRRIPLP